MLSESIQNYLKEIYLLGAEGKTVTTSALAESLGISSASVTSMIKKLAAMKLSRHSPYRGVELTPAGEKIALEMIRHHRLIETFLAQALGVPWDCVHAEAERIEHVISEDLEERIANFLGEPTHDPHGDPIPTKAGILINPRRPSLAEIPDGETAVVQRIGAQDPDHLRHLSQLGIIPHARIDVIHHEPFQGPLRVRVAHTEHVLAEDFARQIWVTRSKKAHPTPAKKV
jgi:DtxR family transcriptional regulator, Mn-dependent transcriptional regulator